MLRFRETLHTIFVRPESLGIHPEKAKAQRFGADKEGFRTAILLFVV
jgi:hypothetical protein